MIDDYAYIIGGRGEKGYYDQLIPVRFSMPINSRPDSYTFTWPKSDNVYRFRDKFVDYDFKARGFAAGFAVGDEIFYGMGEGLDENGNTVFYSDMVKFDRNTGFLPKVCSPYMNVKSPESSVSRSTVIHGGDRAFVVGGTMQGDGDFTILNNSSTAVVNVPNQYVNDIVWETSLYGQTNGELVQKIGFQKNIYENLLVNFNNSITITNDDIYMATPSARLNNSILSELDYNQAKMGWVRINFVGQTRDLPIELTRITNRRYTIDITLYAGEDINSIQILSEDKQTIYDSFKIDYELGKSYYVTRIVAIGG
jgi:hypothetical protein